MAVTQNKSRHRIESIDILKGIGILFMVFAHFGWGGGVRPYIHPSIPYAFILYSEWIPLETKGY